MTDDKTKNPKGTITSLTEDDIVEQAAPRRSVLAIISATVLGGAAKALGGCIAANPQPIQTGPVYAQPQQQYGQPQYAQPQYVQQPQYAQPQGVVVQQQGGYRTGLTDSDSGSYADPVGNGRGTTRLGQTGITDSDSGNWADGVGHGRGRRW